MANFLYEGELLAACSSLGFNDGVKYHKDAECFEIIKDLIRYLRKDDDNHNTRRSLGQTKVLQKDLIPIIKSYSDDKELFDVTLRLLVNMTTPILLIFNEELPEEKVTRQQYHLMGNHQQEYKAAFAEEEIWNVLVTHLGKLLHKDIMDRDEDDRLIIERILILIRNILSVASNPEDEKRTDDDASIHDQVLWALHSAKLKDILMYIAASETEHDYCMHTLEIIYLMLREQDATQLGQAGLQRTQSEKDKDVKELEEMRRREEIKKKQKFKNHITSRHSRFGGSYVVKNMKSISDNDLICHKLITDVNSIDFDQSKRSKKIARNRLPLQDLSITRRSTLAVRLFLQEFCIEFLSGAYNSIMYTVQDNLKRAKAQEHDESYYLWGMKFFLEFNRSHGFKIEMVSESICVESFHYIQMQLDNYYETMTTDKKKIPALSKRMHKALGAYKELLFTLSCMDKNESNSVREASKVLKSKLFYVIEYRELLLTLLQNYTELKMTKAYLKDLIETNHIFMKLLEGFCGKQRHLIVQSKSRKKSKKQRKKPIKKAVLTEEELYAKWNGVTETVTRLLRTENAESLPQTNPFDSVSEVSEEIQKENAMKKINTLLRQDQFPEGISLMKSSREIWPEGNIFGEENMDIEQELQCLQAIFMANINVSEEIKLASEAEDSSDSEEEEEEMEQSMPRMSEQELNFNEFVRRFSHTKVIQAYSLIFKDFLRNSEITNHSILKLFHRLAWDGKMVAIFFQASLFRSFQEILAEPKGISKQIDDAVKFIKFIIKKFFEISQTNDKVFIELLFWKTNKEAIEIECGYGIPSQSEIGKAAHWSEEEEDELHRLYEEFKDKAEEDKDVVELILENLIKRSRTRRGVIKKLKDIGLVRDLKQLTKKPVKTKAAREWTEMEELDLRHLVAEYIDTTNPIGRIMDMMTAPRPKHRVIDKILELGLVGDKSELKKKRVKKIPSSRNKKNQGESFLAANRDSSEESDKGNSSEEDSNTSGEDSSGNEAEDRVPSTKVTPEELKSTLSRIVDEQKDALEWLKDLMQETAEEREKDGDFEPIPLLAITTDCSDALENENFQDFLRIIGIKPPMNHQEMFWRIPSNLSIEALKKRAHYINQALEGELDDASLIESLQETQVPSSEQKRLKKKTKLKKKIKKTLNKSSDESSDDEEMTPSRSVINHTTDESSDDEEMTPSRSVINRTTDEVGETLSVLNRVNLNKQVLNEESVISTAAQKKRRIVINDSDESDKENCVEDSSLSIKSPSDKKSFVIHDDSDDNEEDNVSVAKRSFMIHDDSDESDQGESIKISSSVVQSNNIRSINSDDDDISKKLEKSSNDCINRAINTDDDDSDEPLSALKNSNLNNKRSLKDNSVNSIPVHKKRRIIVEDDSDEDSCVSVTSDHVKDKRNVITENDEDSDEEKVIEDSSITSEISHQIEEEFVPQKKKSKLVIDSDDSD